MRLIGVGVGVGDWVWSFEGNPTNNPHASKRCLFNGWRE